MAGNPTVFDLLEEMLNSGKTPKEVCHDCPELLSQVEQRWHRFCLIDAEVDALLSDKGERPDADVLAPSPDAVGLPQVPGYEVEAVLGRGGMGVVYKARHVALKRTVALKMLDCSHARLGDRARFEAEAETVARLQHPNIVQIYEIGETNGLPFFALEFVEGGSLASRLAGEVLPPRDAAHLVATLAVAMHLAHSCNLVHRDLKPGNVLLAGAADTPIGQCQLKVSDFGLARQLDADSGQTQVGVVMGTPSYMAPEQAEGRAHSAGPAADTYALGAILYECLTGRPPFKGTTQLETLEQVRSREPAAPSSLNRQVPRDLETICLKCLRKKPEQRYSSARELADDLGRFERGEPVSARPVSVAERVRKWVWRHPTAAGLLAAVMLLATAGAVGAWLFYQQQVTVQARQAHTDQEVRGILERARGLLAEGWRAHDLAKLTEAEAEGSRAVNIARSLGGSAALQQEAETFREDASGRLGRAKKTRTLLAAVLDVSVPQETSRYTRDEAGRLMVLARPSLDEQYAAAFLRWGLDVDGTAEAEVVNRLGAEPNAVVQELIAALDNWMLARRKLKRPKAEWRRLFRVAEQLDRGELHRQLRALLIGEAPPRAETVAGLVGVGLPWPALWAQARGSNWRQLLEVRKEINPRTAPVLTVALLARAFAAVGDAPGAEQVLRQAATAQPGQVVLLYEMGKLLERQGRSRLDEAIGYYRSARGLRDHLGFSLSKALLRAGRAAEAGEVMQELVLQQPTNPAFYFELGVAAFRQEKYGDSQTCYRKAIDLRPDFSEAYNNLGTVLFKQMKYGDAEAAFRKAIDLDPDFDMAYSNLGAALIYQQKHGEAEAVSRKAIALKPGLADAHNGLGSALHGQQRYGEAEAAFRKAIALKPDFAEAYSNLGAALNEQQKHGEAEAILRKAIVLKPDSALAYSNLGAALNGQRKYGEAQIVLQKAIALKPDLANAYNNLGNALGREQRHGEAEAVLRKAIALNPDYAVAQISLGAALMGQKKYGEAEAAFRKAIALKPDFANAHKNLGFVLLRMGRYPEAEAASRKAIDLNPAFSEAYVDLGKALSATRKYRESKAAYQKAIDCDPSNADAHYNLGNVAMDRQRYSEAEVAYRKTLELKPGLKEAYYCLGAALMLQARFDEAAAALQKASDLLSAKDPLLVQVRQLLQQCRRYMILDTRLPVVLRGTEKPAKAAEQIEFAELCRIKKLYAATAHFYGDAFTAEPKLADDVRGGARYNAACAAALAGCGQGKDADKLEDKERARLRRRALDWLREDLTWWGKELGNGTAQSRVPTRQRLQLSQSDPDLAGVHDRDRLARLPDEERKSWQQLWSDVDAMLRRISEPE